MPLEPHPTDPDKLVFRSSGRLTPLCMCREPWVLERVHREKTPCFDYVEPEQKVWCDCGDSIEPDSGAKCGNCVAGDSAGPEQEPVGWQWLDTANYRKKLPADAIPEHWRPLYTALTPRKPLTDEEIAVIASTPSAVVGSYVHTFARAIERAHGITGETK